MYPQQLLDYKPIEEKFDPYAIPPKLHFATQHSQSKKVGYINFQKHGDYKKLCECCQMPVVKDPISICVDTDQLQFLGDGFPLFFQMFKLYGCLLLLTFAVVGIYNITTTAKACYSDYVFNLDDENVSNTGCYHFIGIAYSTQKTNEQLTIQAALNLCGTVLMGLGLYVIKYRQKKTKSLVYDYEPKDFTILLTGMPVMTNQEIEMFLNANFRQSQPLEIANILQAQNVEQFVEDSQKKVDLLTHQRRVFAKFLKPEEIQKREVELKKIMIGLQILDERLLHYENILKKRDNLLNTGYVLVTFEDEDDVQYILMKSKKSVIEKLTDQFCFDMCVQHKAWKMIGQHRINIRRAPNPLDVQWNNLNVSNFSKRLRRILALSLNFSVVGVGFFMVYGISYSQNKAKSQNSFFVRYVLSALCSVGIQVVNYVLEYLVKLTSKYERHSTFTHETRSVVLNQSIMQFINTALVPFGLFLFTDFNQDNLVTSLFFIFLGNVIFLPLLEILDPIYLYRIYLKHKIIKDGIYTEYTQIQTNQIFEGPDYRIADKYSSINKSLMMCAFYLAIFPYGAIMEIISLIFYYWCCKYTLLKRCAWPPNLSFDLQNSVSGLLTILPLIMAAGGICYQRVILSNSNDMIIHIANLVSGALIVVGIDNSKFDTKNFVMNSRVKKRFSNIREELKSDYNRSNPANI